MTTKEKIKEVAKSTFPTWSLIFGDWDDADMAVNKSVLPAIVYILPNGGKKVIRNGRVFDSENNLIGFVDKDKRDADGEDNLSVYEEMKEAADLFIFALNASGYFETITSWSYGTIYEQMSDIVTGVTLEVTLTSKEGVCL